jgi:hypothetical protein
MIMPTSKGHPGWRTVSVLLSSLIPFLAFGAASAGARPVEPKNLRWAVYYGAEARPEVFDPYDLVVLCRVRRPEPADWRKLELARQLQH